MRDAFGVLTACALVRMFWDGVMGFVRFYNKYRLPPPPKEVPWPGKG